jgi:RNA polymerase sigma factor (TIGR02999 family)
MSELTDLFAAVRRGDRAAGDRLYQVLYDELRRMARARMRQGSRMTLLDTTVLVNESYLRLAEGRTLDVADKAHFLAYAGRVMRSIVVDFARRRSAKRRGGSAAVVTLTNQVADSVAATDPQILRLDEALEELAAIDQQLVRIVEMRFFVGLSEKEIAKALGVSDRTVRREWEKARLLLRRVLAD